MNSSCTGTVKLLGSREDRSTDTDPFGTRKSSVTSDEFRRSDGSEQLQNLKPPTQRQEPWTTRENHFNWTAQRPSSPEPVADSGAVSPPRSWRRARMWSVSRAPVIGSPNWGTDLAT